jgi:hypothetical protein
MELQANNQPMNTNPGVTVLPQDVCWRLLRSAEVGRLAVSGAAGPDIFPINYVVDHGTIVFRTAQGTKLAAATASAAVAFEADGYDASVGEAWSVVIKGAAEEIKRLHEVIDTSDLPLFPWNAAPMNHFVRLVPEVISGRRFHVVDSSAWGTPTTGARRSAHE